MRVTLIISFCISMFTACRENQSSGGIVYIKILKEQSADSVTEYNKGIALDQYLSYSFENDSAVYRSVTYYNPRQTRTLIGTFGNASYKDTLLMIVKVLANSQNGVLVVEPNMYYDPEPATFHLEYKDRLGVHKRSFVTIGNDTLGRFAWFLYRLPDMAWDKQETSEALFDSEKEIVEAAKANGTYSR